MKAFALIATDSSSGPMAVPDNGFDNILKFVLVLVTLVGCCVMRRIRKRRAAQRRAIRTQQKAWGTLLTRLRIESRLNFQSAKAAKAAKALTPKQHAMQEFSEKFGTQVWCHKAISKGDRVTYMGWSWCTGIVDDFDQDDKLMVTQPCGCTDVWPRSSVRLCFYAQKCQQGIGSLPGEVLDQV
eukprot:symbB.v1.2.025924.t1/scaffold2551.1/size76478/10